MAGETVFITGGNGHIGLKVVVYALQAGYRVLAALRSQEKAQLVAASPSIKALNPGDRLKFVIIPDLLKPGAYDDALRDADYAIHLASPITSGITDASLFETQLINPALRGTENFLEAAAKAPKLRRAVITSSIVAIISIKDLMVQPTDTIFNENSRIADPSGPYSSEFAAYSASKTLALNMAERWMKERKPHFSLAFIHPSFVLGRDELVHSVDDFLRGTNGVPFRQILGVPHPPALPGNTIHLDDTALAHVKALDENVIPDGQSLVTTSGGISGIQWGDAIDVVRKHYPKAVQSGLLLPNGGTRMATLPVKIDTTESERLLGYTFKPYEDQVTNLTEHYLALKGVEAA